MTERVAVRFAGGRGGECQLSWGQTAIWRAIQRLVPDDASLNMSWVTAIEDEGIATSVPVERVTGTVAHVMARHESLRTNVRDGRQVVAQTGVIEVHLVEAARHTAAEAAQRLRHALAAPAFDYADEWPLRVGMVRADGVVTHAVFVICHLVTDRGGLDTLVGDVLSGLAGTPSAEPPDRQPYDLALHQASPQGRRQSAKALRYWERHLRAVPRQRFAETGAPPRYTSATLSSPAGDLAVSALAGREQVSGSTVVLAAAALQLARQTGAREAVLQVIVSNRFRPGLAGSVGPASQDGLCVVEVGDDDLRTVIRRTAQASMQAYLHAQYDPEDLDKLLAEHDVDLSCSFNDRRFDAQTGPGTPAADIRAELARTTLRWEPVEQYGARYFLHVNAVPRVLDLTLFADVSVFPEHAVEAHLRGIEALLVAEALQPA
ncbi:condensation domain-containing protein [Dactylosporangium sp. AC04546]|uniref:condensation domain-containing protein n=1 Tax=Dactylosporangium sp. AC04546 TaxID=2862460 RepID=UPI001EDDBBD8|nr:condensation domain-containing protein [Dactylosporangium sp. AC04546]WVK86159.1 condensation domain-containing protein [Dactylosporangium sp. AC04546]